MSTQNARYHVRPLVVNEHNISNEIPFSVSLSRLIPSKYKLEILNVHRRRNCSGLGSVGNEGLRRTSLFSEKMT